ncbi:MAG: hypothetical protein U5L03_01335 [Burkholderiaceae bacterium]|nr:hypothetical protein [Burkholderiaceae bacterium]
MKQSRWLSLALGLALAAGLHAPPGAAAPKVDVCAVFKKHAPKDIGLTLEKAVSVTPEFCQAWSPGNTDTLLLRVSKISSAVRAVSGTRQSAVNSGNGVVADEAGLGTGAWSQRDKQRIEITFAVKEQFATVLLNRDGGLGDADAAKARAFAKAVTGDLR